MFCNPAYRMTRLNGIPSQTLAMITDTRAHSGEVSQLIWPPPKAVSTEFTIPLSLLSIHDHVDADTIIGSSHGIRNAARKPMESGKLVRKKTARASPSANWTLIETRVNTNVFTTAERSEERRVGTEQG